MRTVEASVWPWPWLLRPYSPNVALALSSLAYNYLHGINSACMPNRAIYTIELHSFDSTWGNAYTNVRTINLWKYHHLSRCFMI